MHHLGIIHPGEMGISIAAAAQNSGSKVFWASEGRSPETQARAKKYHLVDMVSLDKLAKACDMLISICPPAAAEKVADSIIETGYRGRLLDANAISPQRARRIESKCLLAGITFIDGGIIGGPAWHPGSTVLLLSGAEAKSIEPFFAKGPLATSVLGPEVGSASALKMCFAAYTKGTTALLAGVLGAAEGWGVREDLEKLWSRNESDFADQTALRVRRVTKKAWRFIGEMDEIAATFEGAGLPGGFHQSASAIYTRIASLRGLEETPAIEVLLEALLKATEGKIS